MKNSAHLSTGDVLHCRGNRLLSKLIRRFTKSRFSHTAIAIRIEGSLFIADSQNDGTHLRPYKDWMKKYNYKFEVHKLNTPERHAYNVHIRSNILASIGTRKYDYASLLWYHPRYILTGKWKGKSHDNASNRFYCSEFVAYCIMLDNWFKLDPQALYEEINKDSRFKVYLPMGKIVPTK